MILPVAVVGAIVVYAGRLDPDALHSGVKVVSSMAKWPDDPSPLTPSMIT